MVITTKSTVKHRKKMIFLWEVQEGHLGSMVSSIILPSQKENMERNEIKSTSLQVLIYIAKRKNGMKRNPWNPLAGDGVRLLIAGVCAARQENVRIYLLLLLQHHTTHMAIPNL